MNFKKVKMLPIKNTNNDVYDRNQIENPQNLESQRNLEYIDILKEIAGSTEESYIIVSKKTAYLFASLLLTTRHSKKADYLLGHYIDDVYGSLDDEETIAFNNFYYLFTDGLLNYENWANFPGKDSQGEKIEQ